MNVNRSIKIGDLPRAGIILAAAVLTAGYLVFFRLIPYYRAFVVIGSEAEEAAIFIMPDDIATRASANYLAGSVENALGIRPDIVTRKEPGGRYISIVYDEGAEIPDEEEPLYTLSVEKCGMTIRVHGRDRCFGAVKAVTDRWLQRDCGLKGANELCISRAAAEKQLMWLSTVVNGELKILSQNLRYKSDENGNSIEERAGRFAELVAEYRPDLIGTQECTAEWLRLLQAELGDRYKIYGCSRDGSASESGEWNAVLYRKDRFTFQNGNTFWLSNTPETEASQLNYSGCIRICTWAQLLDNETGKALLFGNTHLQEGISDSYEAVRARQTDILVRRLQGITAVLSNPPGFLTGDFNGEAGEDYYSEIVNWYVDSRTDAITDSSAVDYSFHGYGQTDALIDFCFHSPDNVTILNYQILDKQYGGYVSDHHGVLVSAVLN